MSIKFKLTVPKVNENWWRSSKNELNKIVEEHNKDSWSGQKDPVTGSPWAPRKQPTGSWPILKKSGKMLGSTKFKAPSQPMMFSAKTGVNYGKFHQQGTSKMPQRRWLGLGPQVTSKMAKVISKHIFKGKKTYGG